LLFYLLEFIFLSVSIISSTEGDIKHYTNKNEFNLLKFFFSSTLILKRISILFQ